MANKKTILGLDLGTSSIGWGLLELSESLDDSKIVRAGVRIFQETTDKKSKEPKNASRRDKRGMRRTISRRVRRHKHLQNTLRQAGVFPDDEQKVADILTKGELGCNPYAFRKKGLDEKLALHEFGRVLCHLNQRRGFQSNRKEGSKAKEDTDYKKMMAELQQTIENTGARTIGEYLANLPATESKRGKHTTRAMYEHEFEMLWEAQKTHYPSVLTSALKVQCHKAIFHQRPYKTPHSKIGPCTFEPTKKRCPRAAILAQHQRIWQDINNLQRIDPQTYEKIELTGEQRRALFEYMDVRKEASFNDIRTKVFGMHEKEQFNLESENRTKLKGNTTFHAIKSKLKDKGWKKLMPEQREQLVEDLITSETNRTEGLLRRLTGHWGFDEETAEKLAYANLEDGYARLSVKALRKIVPHMARGLRYDEACDAAGYHHSDIKLTDSDINRLLGDIRNPVVTKALRQTAKVVRAIVNEYGGKPDEIVIEMARDMKLSGKKKEEADKRRYQYERENERVKAILENEFGMQPSRTDILKYRLWEECGRVCPYTGQVIEREMLFSGDIDIEHIIPYSLSLDDSYMNKTLCMAEENRLKKRNRTPMEAYGVDGRLPDAMWQRVRSMPCPLVKKRKFTQRELDDDFVSRQLNDTRYICKAVKQFFEAQGYKVRVSKGQVTSLLRYKWRLEHILGKKSDGKKSRDDHRHHAIDGIVTACVSQGMLQRLSRESANLRPGEQLRDRDFRFGEPWPGFVADVEKAIDEIVVSHQPLRGIHGALHEETAWGIIAGDEDALKRGFVRRVPVASLTDPQVGKIVDKTVRELVAAHRARIKSLKEQLGMAKKSRNFDLRDELQQRIQDAQEDLKHVDGVTPIKTVRVADNKTMSTMMAVCDKTGKPYKYYALGSNHHVEIIRHKETGKHEGRFVSMLEAAHRARHKRIPIVQYDHGPEWEFVMWLCINDIVSVKVNEECKHYRVQALEPTANRIWLRCLTAATLEDNADRILMSISKIRMMDCKKLHVDPIGRVREYIDAKNP